MLGKTAPPCNFNRKRRDAFSNASDGGFDLAPAIGLLASEGKR
jgi:hypothetical protein